MEFMNLEDILMEIEKNESEMGEVEEKTGEMRVD